MTMMPGQAPYTEEAQVELKRLVEDAARAEELIEIDELDKRPLKVELH